MLWNRKLRAFQNGAFVYFNARTRPYRRNMIANGCLICLGSLSFMMPPIMTKYILETVLPKQNWGLLLIVCFCTVLVPVIGSAIIVVETYTMRFIMYLAGRGRAELYNGYQSRPIAWMQSRKPGDLITRTLDDSETLVLFADNQMWWMLWLTITITVGSVVLILLQPALAAILLLLWAAHAVLLSRLGRRIKQRAAESARQASRVMEAMRETLTAAAFIKANGREIATIGKLEQSLQRDMQTNRRSALTSQSVEFVNLFLSSCFLAVMYYAGGRLVVSGQMSIGSLLAFAAVYNWLRPFGIAFFDTYFAAKKAVPALERIVEVADPVADSDFAVSGRAKARLYPPGGAYDLQAVNLHFRHGERPVLQDIYFRIPEGSVVSIVGVRGSGKSTLTELLLGLREPSSGVIALGGIPLPLLEEDWLRRHVLCITQDVLLRNGTVLDNIVYSSDVTDPQAVQEAIQLAELEDWLAQLPDGLHTRVGEQGLILSGGERQRISIARALLRKPKVLVLDEATSALDLRTEQRLLERLITRKWGTTLIFVTHRASVTRMSDQIFAVENGTLREVKGVS